MSSITTSRSILGASWTWSVVCNHTVYTRRIQSSHPFSFLNFLYGKNTWFKLYHNQLCHGFFWSAECQEGWLKTTTTITWSSLPLTSTFIQMSFSIGVARQNLSPTLLNIVLTESHAKSGADPGGVFGVWSPPSPLLKFYLHGSIRSTSFVQYLLSHVGHNYVNWPQVTSTFCNLSGSYTLHYILLSRFTKEG